ncbi:hypothetical protein GQX74_011422 [Glossina fuscipes]|nr:hypothetical protein GQX74_011422 [Glossina fuscipes]
MAKTSINTHITCYFIIFEWKIFNGLQMSLMKKENKKILLDVDELTWIRRSLFTPKFGSYTITNSKDHEKKTVTYSPIGTRTLRGQIHTMIWIIILIIHYFGQTEISNFDFTTNIAFGKSPNHDHHNTREQYKRSWHQFQRHHTVSPHVDDPKPYYSWAVYTPDTGSGLRNVAVSEPLPELSPRPALPPPRSERRSLPPTVLTPLPPPLCSSWFCACVEFDRDKPRPLPPPPELPIPLSPPVRRSQPAKFVESFELEFCWLLLLLLLRFRPDSAGRGGGGPPPPPPGPPIKPPLWPTARCVDERTPTPPTPTIGEGGGTIELEVCCCWRCCLAATVFTAVTLLI